MFMKKLLILAVLSCAMLSSCCNGKYETVKGDLSQTQIYTLDNGLKIYMSVNKTTPRIQTAIAVRVGGKNDPAETTGLAHYFEHLMFKGTENFGTSDYAAEKPLLDEIESLFEVYRMTTDEAQRSKIYHRIDSLSYEASKIAIPNEYDKLMSLIGAQGTNAFTSTDVTCYVEDIPSNQIENWAKIQADRFRHPVIRGFHTELETIYEEKNMSLTQDGRKMWEATLAALFPHHPYGTQTVLGTQEHLKNPSITNVKNYHKTWYVPNNMAVCVAGDFDPDYMVSVIEKYFGDMEPNPEIPELRAKVTANPATPITEPLEVEVKGLEAEYLYMAWRLPEITDKSIDVAEVAGSVLSNGKAGLIDLDLNQQQKTLVSFAELVTQPDGCAMILGGYPKQGQTLEQVRDLLLGEVAKLRDGDFDEALIKSIVNNMKKDYMSGLENNRSRAMECVDAFVNGEDWAEHSGRIERISKVSKADIQAWAAEFLADNNYAVIYKRQGEDKSVKKIAAPKITPIVTNRDLQSDFLVEIANSEVKPIEPVFVDFKKEMSEFDLCDGVEVLYKKNTINELFNISYIFDISKTQKPELPLALSYIQYLGTSEMSNAEISAKMYDLAVDHRAGVGKVRTSVSFSGLSDSMDETLKLFKQLLDDVQGDEAVLANLKSDEIKSRTDNKLNQSMCFSALSNYAYFGPEQAVSGVLSDEQIMALTSEQLIDAVRDLFNHECEVLYYGPASQSSLKKSLSILHDGKTELKDTELDLPELQLTPTNTVLLAQYDAKQLYFTQYSCDDREFDSESQAGIELYDNYFGGGMNSVVFQEMREARGLAYSAWASLSSPEWKDGKYYYMAFIATQNDKLRQALDAFDDIINNMPESEASFAIAKESMISDLRTKRIVGKDVLNSYIDCRDLGLDEPLDKAIWEAIQTMTLDDVKAVQKEWVKDRNYTYCILGDIKDLDMNYLKTLGPVKIVSIDDIFGY